MAFVSQKTRRIYAKATGHDTCIATFNAQLKLLNNARRVDNVKTSRHLWPFNTRLNNGLTFCRT